MRRLLLTICLACFCLGVVVGCTNSPAGEKDGEQPSASTTAEE